MSSTIRADGAPSPVAVASVIAFTIGSFASGVINHLTAPVFAIPPAFKLKPISHILYPVDLQDPREDVNIVLRIAKMFDAFIHLVHISKKRTDENFTAAETLHKIAGKMGYEKVTTSVKTGGKIEALIIESIQEENADLLVMFPKAKGFFEQVFHGSITEEISHNITIPLLTIQQIKPGTYREHADF